MGSDDQLSNRVVMAVAAAEGVDPTDLSETLYPAIDGDALDAIFCNAPGSVTFEYSGYEVTADSDGDVSVVPLERA
ncbi:MULTISPECIES: HalOD1 output domain-containing protein [Haloarcula]|uniref:Halobacterial output domain-containing protein n=1 Tax=Haloarcula pellucida TaxID=1427151 RepID=A0A830GIL5_9EURY|nr:MULTISPECIES: HalOD1 output domain-containing protein [Halomicroarcula]MBX0346828.1 hypothetical protein [Halomicroarcula pellucida]MDS0277298.1 hypothetical protein [Halomicroarcula sp. S1AR25-4]GGN85677.1 hypothetical protein GCM10009030_02480 [Halomicroarcula pellucida]